MTARRYIGWLCLWRAFVVAIGLSLLLNLSGCATPAGPILPTPPVTATPIEKQKVAAQETVAQATRALLIAQDLLLQEIDVGVLTKAELKSIQARLKEARQRLDEANQAIKEGRLETALKSATDADALANAAERFLAKRIRERRKP